MTIMTPPTAITRTIPPTAIPATLTLYVCLHACVCVACVYADVYEWVQAALRMEH